MYKGTLSGVLFALFVREKIPLSQYFYTSTAIDAMDKYQVWLCKITWQANLKSIETNDVVALHNMLKLVRLIWKCVLKSCHWIFLKVFDLWLQPLGMGMLLFISSTPIQKTREGRPYHHLQLAKYLKGGLWVMFNLEKYLPVG